MKIKRGNICIIISTTLDNKALYLTSRNMVLRKDLRCISFLTADMGANPLLLDFMRGLPHAFNMTLINKLRKIKGLAL